MTFKVVAKPSERSRRRRHSRPVSVAGQVLKQVLVGLASLAALLNSGCGQPDEKNQERPRNLAPAKTETTASAAEIDAESDPKSENELPPSSVERGIEIARKIAEPAKPAAEEADAVAALRALNARIELQEDGYSSAVDCSYCKLGDDDLRHLIKLTQLRQVVLNFDRATLSGAALEQLTKLPQLEALILYGATLPEGGVDQLAKLTRLKQLSFEDIELTDAQLKQLTPLTNLEKLQLSSASLTAGGLVLLTSFEKLTELVLPATAATGTDLSFLQGIPDLTRLVLEGTSLSDAELAHLGSLKKLQELVPPAFLGDEGVRHIGLLGELRSLDLGFCSGITDSGLSPLTALSNLESLNLSDTQIGDAGMEQIGKLHQLTKLELPEQVGDAGLRRLASLGRLRYLDLGETQITDAGLIDLQSFPQLETLYLTNTKITDLGLEQLTKLSNLRELGLVQTQVSDRGVVHLERLAKLEMLAIVNTEISTDGVKRIHKALPNADIRY